MMYATVAFRISLLVVLLASCGSYENDYFLMPYREGNKWGLCDTLGKVQVKPQYDGFVDMIVDQQSKQSFYFVKKDGRTVVVDHNNEQHLKEFDSVDPGHQRVYKNGKVGLYFYKPGNSYQKTIGSFIIYADAIYTAVQPMEARGMYMLDLNGKKGLLHAEYGRASIHLQPEYDKIVFDKPFYNAYKGEVVEAQYRDPKQSSSGGGDIDRGSAGKQEREAEKEKQKQKDDEYRRKLIENLKRDASPEDLKKIMPFEITPSNKYVKFRENGKQGYAHFSFSLSGATKKLIKQEVMPAEYDSISEYGGFNFLIKKDGKYGFTLSQKVILEPIYDDIKFYNTVTNELIVKKGLKYAVFKLSENRFFTDFIYDDYTFLPKSEYLPHVVLQRGNKKVLWFGEQASAEYDDLTPFIITKKEGHENIYSDAIMCQDGSRYGLLKEGSVFVPAAYDSLYVSPDGLLITVKGGKKGTYGEFGQINISPRYESVELSKDFAIGDKRYLIYKVTNSEGVQFYTDRFGKEFYKPQK